MLLTNVDGVNIYALAEPPLLFCDLDIVAAHLSLPHSAVCRKGPVLKPVTPLPFHPVVCILILVPELDGDLVIPEGEEFFAQPVVELFVPLGGQEADD